MKKINESRTVDITGVSFAFNVDSDGLRARFIPKTSKDLDKLSDEDDVAKVIKGISDSLKKATGFSWSYDSVDQGAGYSFIPDMNEVAAKIENEFS